MNFIFHIFISSNILSQVLITSVIVTMINDTVNGYNTVDYPNFTDTNFYKKIFCKREFYENRYHREWWKYSSLVYHNNEETTAQQLLFKLQPHQKLIPKYLGPHTPYNGSFLFHGTGTGKTICSFSCIEGYKIFLDEHSSKALVITPSEWIMNEFIGEILGRVAKPDGTIFYERRSSGNRYVDEPLRQRLNRSGITTKERYDIEKFIKTHRIGRYYEFQTHMKFVNSIKDMTDDQIREAFSHRVIVVDEIHKARNEKLLWGALSKIFTVAYNLRILFLSATSSFDSAKELCPTINLLKMNDYVYTTLSPKIIDGLCVKKVSVNTSIRNEFRQMIKGYVSYLRGCNPFTFPQRIEVGIPFQKNIKFCTIRCNMHPIQLEEYTNQFMADFNPNGEAGEANELWKNTRKTSRFFKPDEVEWWTTENIAKYSCKTAEMWNIILKTSFGKGAVLIYLFNLETGIHDVEEFFKHLGVAELTPDNSNVKGPKYVNLSRNHSKKWIEFVLELCKSHDNYKGEYVKFILGTGKIRTGLTFRHISQIHILEPDWNIATTEQLIGRGCRHLSHILPKKFFENNPSCTEPSCKKRKVESCDTHTDSIVEFERSKVEIFRYRATFRNEDIEELPEKPKKKWKKFINTNFNTLKLRGFIWQTKQDIPIDQENHTTYKVASIDDMMYKIALAKDLKIKTVEREIAENAWDASLQINANYFPEIEGQDVDYTRLADYNKSLYYVPLPTENTPSTAKDISNVDLNVDNIDNSTFGMLEWSLLCNNTVDKELDSISLNYIDEELIHDVIDLFRIRTKWVIEDIQNQLAKKYKKEGRASIDWKIIYTILEYHIRQQIPIIFDEIDAKNKSEKKTSRAYNSNYTSKNETFILIYANNVYLIQSLRKDDSFSNLTIKMRLRDTINYDTAIEDFFEHVVDEKVDLEISKYLDPNIINLTKDLKLTLIPALKSRNPPVVTGSIINTVDKPNLYRLEIWTGEKKLAAQSIGTRELHSRFDMINEFYNSKMTVEEPAAKKIKGLHSRVQKSKLSSKITQKLRELNLFLPWALSTSKNANCPSIYRMYKAALYWKELGHFQFEKIINYIEESVKTWMSGKSNRICDWMVDVVIKILQSRLCIPSSESEKAYTLKLKQRLTDIFIKRYNNNPEYILKMLERMHGKRPKKIEATEWKDIVVQHYKENFLKPKEKWIQTATETMYFLVHKYVLISKNNEESCCSQDLRNLQ